MAKSQFKKLQDIDGKWSVLLAYICLASNTHWLRREGLEKEAKYLCKNMITKEERSLFSKEAFSGG